MMAEPFIGEIRQFAGNYEPQGWVFCDGRLLPISEYEILFSLIGTTYGGDGQTTFAVPDFRGRAVVSQGQNLETGTTYVIGQKAGTEEVTLTEQQLPSHTHGVQAVSAGAVIADPTDAVWTKGTVSQYATNDPNQTMNSANISRVGNSQPHENMMPYITVNYIIALNGIYPTRG